MRSFFLILVTFLQLFTASKAYCQSQVFWLTITDSTAIDHIDTIGANYIPAFVDPLVQGSFASGGGTISIEQAMPWSDYRSLRQQWRVRNADSAFLNMLVANHPALFPAYRRIQAMKPLSHFPNDWTRVSHPTGSDYLTFIGAQNAWDSRIGGTKGDSTVIIGVFDDYFDSTIADIRDNAVKIVNSPTFNGNHGTCVAGIAAGRTNNDTMFASIGYRCKMNLATSETFDPYATMLRLTKDTSGGRMRVLNCSRYDGYLPGPLVIDWGEQKVLDEMYENGISAVFSTGNGFADGDPPGAYTYPASLDYSLSITSVGYLRDTGSSHLKDIHEAHTAGDSTKTHAHNDRVDICAPGWSITMLDNGNTWQTTSGTSYAAPIVSGTCGLMYSQQSCLTPYQVEYILKKTSKDIYLETHDGINFYNYKYYDGNSRYTSRLGAGRLQADKAVFMADTFECNDTITSTMTIEGVTVSHKCLPGTVAGTSQPQLKIGRILHGKAPYRYLWTPMTTNTVAINTLTGA